MKNDKNIRVDWRKGRALGREESETMRNELPYCYAAEKRN
jgi:hypothetical protein